MEMDKFYSKINYRLIDESLITDMSQLDEIDHVCNMADIHTTVSRILDKQKDHYILVITESMDICNLVLAINPTLKDHKLSVLCGDKLYADEAIAEWERLEKMLHTESGAEYFPAKQIGEYLYTDENGLLLLKLFESQKNKSEILLAYDEQLWGNVLPFKEENIVGTVQENINDMPRNERYRIISKVLSCFKEESLTETMCLIDSEQGYEILPLSGKLLNEKELYSLIYEVCFGHKPQKDKMCSLLKDREDHPEYPNCLFEFFEIAFADRIYPGIPCKVSAMKMLENTVERMIIMEGFNS